MIIRKFSYKKDFVSGIIHILYFDDSEILPYLFRVFLTTLYHTLGRRMIKTYHLYKNLHSKHLIGGGQVPDYSKSFLPFIKTNRVWQ